MVNFISYSDYKICIFLKDTFKIFYINEHSNKSIKLNVSKANLAWDTDRKYKFSNLFSNYKKILILN